MAWCAVVLTITTTVALPLMIAQTGTALLRHGPTLNNGAVEGSIRQMLADNATLNGGASVTGDLLIPGTPAVKLNGHPQFAGIVDGPGAVAPTNHRVTLNGNASLRQVIRRMDALVLPEVALPPLPIGTRTVAINRSGLSPGDYTNLKNLTLNGNVGRFAVPPGNYGAFTANGNSGFILGEIGSAAPAVYVFQKLTLNGNSTFEVVGPVTITLPSGFAANASMGTADHPEWLHLRVVNGGLTINGHESVYARLEAPQGTLTLNGGSLFVGTVTADRLVVNGNSRLLLREFPAAEPAFQDVDHDGMDDAWEALHSLNPAIDDGQSDYDGDGVSNLREFQLHLNPDNPDSDGDGLYDGDEISLGRDSTVSTPDTILPSVPVGLVANEMQTDRITLSWQPASDDLRVSGYLVYRDGQPIDTDQPIRGTTFTDADLPDGQEFAYQVRAFDYAGNLSPLGDVISGTTLPLDSDGDGLPDEWEIKYFDDGIASPAADPDGDGLSNLEEYRAGNNPKDFYNGVKPILEKSFQGEPGPNGELAISVHKPDGSPWVGAPIDFTVRDGGRRISITSGGPDYAYQLEVRTDASGLAQVYVEPLHP